MYRVEDLSVHQIGSGLTHQVILKSDGDVLWTSPIFLDASSARATVDHLRLQIHTGTCSECWANGIVLSEVSAKDEYDAEPDLLFLCRLCLNEGQDAAHAELGMDR